MHLEAYAAIMDPYTAKLPLIQGIKALYDEVDSFVIVDASIYDNVDLSMFGKVKKHIKTMFNPFDNPFGSLFNMALKLCTSDTLLFWDVDELIEVKTGTLKDIASKYPLDNGAGIALSLRNYYCNRYHLADGCSSKGAHIFKNREDLFHDLIGGHVVAQSHVRRTNYHEDVSDGVRLVTGEGQPIPHYPPISFDDVIVHHTSHLDLVSKMVRSILQFNHTNTIDLPTYFPFDMRFEKKALDMIYEAGKKDIEDKTLELYKEPIAFDYDKEPYKPLEDYITDADVFEFDPTGFPLMDDPFTGNVQ
jgi:hypothetical protein